LARIDLKKNFKTFAIIWQSHHSSFYFILGGGWCRRRLAAVFVRNGTAALLRLTLSTCTALLKNVIVLLWRLSVLQAWNFGSSEVGDAVDKWFVFNQSITQVYYFSSTLQARFHNKQ